MAFSKRQLPSQKWGIYSDSRLLATVSSQAVCDTILMNLSSGRKDVPTQGEGALYQVLVPHDTRSNATSATLIDQQLAAELGTQQLKVNELESAVKAVQKQLTPNVQSANKKY